jgi:TRAP transporter TAXI family solute receptor
MDWDDITHVPVTSAREGADLFIAGSVDAWLISGCYPPSPLNVEVSETIDVKLLTLGEDESEEISEMLPWSSPEVIPADSYKGQEEDVLSHGHRTVWVSEREVPEDIVYKVTKAVYDNFEEFQGISSDLLAYWSLEAGAIDNPSVPVHPGAIQYYEEIDVWTAQLEELNQSMLDVET